MENNTINSDSNNIVIPAEIKSGYYLNDHHYVTDINTAWNELKQYVASIHEQYPDDIIEYNQAQHIIIIKRGKKPENLEDGTTLSSYVPIKDPVILNPLKDNIHLK